MIRSTIRHEVLSIIYIYIYIYIYIHVYIHANIYTDGQYVFIDSYLIDTPRTSGDSDWNPI